MALLLQPYSVVRRLGIGVEPLHNSGRNRISTDSPFPTAPRGALPRFSHLLVCHRNFHAAPGGVAIIPGHAHGRRYLACRLPSLDHLLPPSPSLTISTSPLGLVIILLSSCVPASVRRPPFLQLTRVAGLQRSQDVSPPVLKFCSSCVLLGCGCLPVQILELNLLVNSAAPDCARTGVIPYHFKFPDRLGHGSFTPFACVRP